MTAHGALCPPKALFFDTKSCSMRPASIQWTTPKRTILIIHSNSIYYPHKMKSIGLYTINRFRKSHPMISYVPEKNYVS